MAFPVDLRFVNEAEQKLGVRFPESFVNYMLKQNGGMVTADSDEWQLYPFFDSSDRKRMTRTASHIVRETMSARSWTEFPPEAVAIGANGSGDQLVFLPTAVSPDQLERTVFWWDHETGEMTLVATDFSELVK